MELWWRSMEQNYWKLHNYIIWFLNIINPLSYTIISDAIVKLHFERDYNSITELHSFLQDAICWRHRKLLYWNSIHKKIALPSKNGWLIYSVWSCQSLQGFSDKLCLAIVYCHISVMSIVVCYFWIIFCYTLVNKNYYHTMCQSAFNIITLVLRTSGHQHLISSSDGQGSNFESCVWRTVSSHSAYHPQTVFLAQFSLYVHKGGLKPHLLSWWSECKLTNSPLCYESLLTNLPSYHSDCNADWEISHDNLNQNSRICQSTMGIWIQIDQSGRSKMMIWIHIEQSANLPWWSESWLIILPIYYGDLNPDLLTSADLLWWSESRLTSLPIYHDDLNLSISGSNHNPDWPICQLARVISTRLTHLSIPLSDLNPDLLIWYYTMVIWRRLEQSVNLTQ